LSSADWMPRNFHRRIEVMAPVEDVAVRARLIEEVLQLGLRDNVKARRLAVDGSYATVERGAEAPVRSQTALLRSPEPKAVPPIPRALAPEPVAIASTSSR